MLIKLRIVTVNLPVSYLNAIETLTGNDGLYPSRSELIRVAVRNFLIRELESAKSFKKYQENKAIPAEETSVEAKVDENFVTIGEKTYRRNPRRAAGGRLGLRQQKCAFSRKKTRREGGEDFQKIRFTSKMEKICRERGVNK